MKKIYVIAEMCIVMNQNDGNGLENDPEPVVCLPLGAWTDQSKAEKLCKKENTKFNKGLKGESRDMNHFVVKEILVR